MGDLVLLPWRVGFRTARFFLHVAESMTEHAIGAAMQAVETVRPGARPAPPPQKPPRQTPAAGPSRSRRAPNRRPASPPPPAAAPVSDATPPKPAPASPPHPADVSEEPPPPVHVSEEAELVFEAAEAGAEDGAGATVTVLEPWEGYRRMTAEEVIGRVRGATAAELAAVELYESTHRRRQSVVKAVSQSLRRLEAAARTPGKNQ